MNLASLGIRLVEGDVVTLKGVPPVVGAEYYLAGRLSLSYGGHRWVPWLLGVEGYRFESWPLAAIATLGYMIEEATDPARIIHLAVVLEKLREYQKVLE